MHLSDFPTLDTSSLAPLQSTFDIPAISFQTQEGGVLNVPSTTIDTVPTLPTVNVTIPTPVEQTLPLTTVQIPKYTPTPVSTPQTNVAPATSTPSQGTDWFSRNVTPIAQAGLMTWAAINQYKAAQAAATLPQGVSPTYLQTARQQLTPAQVASMTPAQQQAYYASLYPNALSAQYGVSTSGSPLGGMSTSTLLLIGGAGLLLMMLMKRQ